MKQLLLLLSFSIFFISCNTSQEEDFFQKKYDTNDIEIISTVDVDSAYSPHIKVTHLYKITHKGLTEENFDSLFNEFLQLRREFMNPTIKNCIKKSYAIKINGEEPQIHTLYYISHRGNTTCIHDKENIFRQLSDIDHNFYHFKKHKTEYQNSNINNDIELDSCQNF